MDRLIKFRTRDTLDRTREKPGFFPPLGSSPSINYPINQRRRRRRARHFAASHNRREDYRQRERENLLFPQVWIAKRTGNNDGRRKGKDTRRISLWREGGRRAGEKLEERGERRERKEKARNVVHKGVEADSSERAEEKAAGKKVRPRAEILSERESARRIGRGDARV